MGFQSEIQRTRVHESSPTASEDPADHRPLIKKEGDNLPEMVDQLHDALLAARVNGQPVIYQRGGVLVRIVRRGPTTARRMSRAAGGLGIVAFDVAALVDLGTQHAAFYRMVQVDKKWVDKKFNCPHEVASVLLARNEWGFPPLTGLIEAPTLRPDGSLLDVPGYDRETGLYYDPGCCEFAPISQGYDRDAAIVCLEDLAEVLDEFPFASDVDLSVALAAILTALVRPSLAGAPLFGFKAQVMGSGKTYLAHAVSLIAQGRQAAVIAPPRDAKEEDKTLFAALLEADPVLVYDNVEHQLASDMLCAILTSETLRGRVLGTSKTAAVSTACVFIATGNNLVIAGDLSARSLVCTLKPKEAHPEHRRFVTDLTTWIPDHRGRLVSSALSFLCAFLASGAKPDMEPWQRFPDWDRLIRASLIWAGLPDPLSALRNAEQQDPRRLEHAAVMAALTCSKDFGPFITEEWRPGDPLRFFDPIAALVFPG
jgi:putative DNA primase/helicase